MTNKNKIVDSWLVLRAKTGDKKACGLLVKRWHSKLCKQAYWYTKDIHSAQDVVQECWPIIIKKLPVLKEPRAFGSWALSIVTRKAIDVIRKNKREAKQQDRYNQDQQHHTTDAAPTEPFTQIQMVRRAIKELPETSQIVLNLFYLEELSIREIAIVLEIAEGTVKSRLFNAREKLKSLIKNRNHEK